MQTAFNYIQIALSAFLVILFILQVKGTGGGFFGGGSGGAYRTRRGFEQTLFRATILIVVVFLAISIVSARIV